MSDDHEIPLEPPETIKLPAKRPLEADERGIIAVIPRNTEEAARYAKAVIAAGIVPDAYTYQKDELEHGTGNVIRRKGEPNEPLILMGILKSLEVGLPPITGLGTIFPVNNRFAVYGDGAIALIQRDRVIAKHIERRISWGFDPATELADWPDEYGWEISYWRKGQEEPYVGRFTVRDSRRAGLWLSRRDPWVKYPDRMLYNRARAFALRDGFADCLHGLGILEEERDRLPEPVDGGTLTTGKPAYLSDEPVMDEPAALGRPIEEIVGDGSTPAEISDALTGRNDARQRETMRDEQPADLLSKDF